MKDDASLLRDYVEKGDETAFRQLVERQVNLVYGAALRRTGGDAHLAADVSQHVFTLLARKARSLSRHPVLSAWLHTATRNAALNLMISEQRRKARESAAAFDAAHDGGEAVVDWHRVGSLLDAAIDELPQPDRAAVVLRFLQHLPFAKIGAALSVSEDAARMRTDRALDKLRAALARRGIKSTTAALAAAMASQTAISAPAGLAATVASQALAIGGVTAFATLALFMTPKLITSVAVSALIAFGIGAYVGHRNGAAAIPPTAAVSPAEPDNDQERRRLEQDNQRLQADAASLRAEVARLVETNAELKAAPPAPPAAVPVRSLSIGMSRGEVQQAVLANLRQIAAAREQYRLQRGRTPGSINDLVGGGQYIRQLRTVDGEDYADLSMEGDGPLTVSTPGGIDVTWDPTGATTTVPEFPPEVLRAQELTRKVQPSLNRALTAYRAANNGNNPPNEQALVPYFGTVEEGADFVELVELQKAAGR